MRAVHVPTAGAQLELGEVPAPTVTPGHVLVRVKAAGLNPVDNAISAGMFAEMLPHEYPLVVGRDAAGVVEAVGDGVDHVAVGDEVLGHVLLAPSIQAGTLAEYALIPAATVIAKPQGLDFVTAAAIPLAGAAAAQSVAAIDARPGQTVLVNGASGGVGSFVVQLLAAQGVTVIATGTPKDADRLRGLGATTVIDHHTSPVADQVRAIHPDGVDALVNLAGYVAADIPSGAVRAGGRIATLTGAPDEETLIAADLTSTQVMAAPTRDVVGALAAQAAAGDLKVQVSSVLTLDQAIEGLGTLAAGHARGKSVITFDN